MQVRTAFTCWMVVQRLVGNSYWYLEV